MANPGLLSVSYSLKAAPPLLVAPGCLEESSWSESESTIRILRFTIACSGLAMASLMTLTLLAIGISAMSGGVGSDP